MGDLKKLFRRAIPILLTVFSMLPVRVSAGPFLPVYIEDSHAGSFYWLARNLNWSEKFQLILFDRHSDATAVFNSDFIRKILNDRKDFSNIDSSFLSWKKRGIIQCFNWLEPLLPHPIDRVIWVPGNILTSDALAVKREEIVKNINEHISAVPRSSGDLSHIFTIHDFPTQKAILNFDEPVIASIDLDYFVDVSNNDIEQKISEIFDYVLGIRRLRAITISISRPYLKSDEQANLLLFNTLKYLSHVINSKIWFEPFAYYGPDRTELARAYYKKGLSVASYDIRKASSQLISLFLQNRPLYIVNIGREKWHEILHLWSQKYKQPELVLSNTAGLIPIRECNYFYYKEAFTISVNMPFEGEKNCLITWKLISPAEKSYNIIGRTGFAANAPMFVLFKEISLNRLQHQREINSDQLNDVFDDRTGFGTIRLFAEIMLNNTYYRTKTICIARYATRDYTGKLTEIFNLPYILGSGVLSVGGLRGADAHYGADCLNFIIYGRRRLGFNIPYLNKNNLRQYLAKVDDVLFFKDGIAYNGRGKVIIAQQLIKDGFLLHFGTHIAALYQDNEPKNILNDDDLIIHQLENKPEIIKLGELRQAQQPFMLMKFR